MVQTYLKSLYPEIESLDIPSCKVKYRTQGLTNVADSSVINKYSAPACLSLTPHHMSAESTTAELLPYTTFGDSTRHIAQQSKRVVRRGQESIVAALGHSAPNIRQALQAAFDKHLMTVAWAQAAVSKCIQRHTPTHKDTHRLISLIDWNTHSPICLYPLLFNSESGYALVTGGVGISNICSWLHPL